jgi:8-oxo-dGTP pyrophosphatase MutT (NUDIX family)
MCLREHISRRSAPVVFPTFGGISGRLRNRYYRGVAPTRVVASILADEGRTCLLRRSNDVGWDRGKWHCVTGYLPPLVAPLEQALLEIYEETGLTRSQLRLLRYRRPPRLVGGGSAWLVFPFLFQVSSTRLSLNWEHDEYRWISKK